MKIIKKSNKNHKPENSTIRLRSSHSVTVTKMRGYAGWSENADNGIYIAPHVNFKYLLQ